MIWNGVNLLKNETVLLIICLRFLYNAACIKTGLRFGGRYKDFIKTGSEKSLSEDFQMA
jgi:hypothetical protein